MKVNSKKNTIKILLIFVIFFLDRITKNYTLNFFENNNIQELIVLENFNIYLIWNEGIAFGLMNFDNHIVYNVITIIIAIVSFVILIFALKTKNYSSYFFTVIFAGALGNLYDRIKFSAVPDFIDLHIGNYHWFIFNVADIFISLGIICLIVDELFVNKINNEKN